MPRVEFKTDAQREIFSAWLAEQYRKKRVNLIGENSRGLSGGYPVKTLEVLEIDEEPIHIETERKGPDYRRTAVRLGDGKIAKELKEAGVIFDAEENGFNVQRNIFRRSTGRFI